MQEKQITIPIVIPLELDSYLCDTVESLVADHRLLLQVHDRVKHHSRTARLPSLRDISGHKGNIRYWLITNNSMWTGQHPVLDEIYHILWIFFGWFDFVGFARRSHDPRALPFSTATPSCLFWVVQCLRRRLGPHPQVHHSDGDLRRRQGLLPLREALLFRSFVYQNPSFAGGIDAWIHEGRQVDEDLPAGLAEDDYWHGESIGPSPVDESPRSVSKYDDYWGDSDEGEWIGEGVPAWIDDVETTQ